MSVDDIRTTIGTHTADVDTTYADDATRPSVKFHQADHDIIVTAIGQVADEIEANVASVHGTSAALATTFSMADHVAVEAHSGTFTPTHSTAIVNVGISGVSIGGAHIGCFFAWNQTVTPGDPLLNGNDFGAGAFVAGTTYRTVGALAGPGNIADANRRILITGLTPDVTVTWEVVTAAIGYYNTTDVGDFPVDMCLDANDDWLYITNFTSGNVMKCKPIWRASADRKVEVVETFTGHSGAYGIAAHPTDPERLFVARFSADQVVEINPLNGGSVTDTWAITGPYFLMVEPDGSHLWVVRQDADALVPIDLSTNLAETQVTGFGDGPWKPVSDGTYLYVPNSAHGTTDTIGRVHLVDRTVSTLSTGGNTNPVALSLSPDNTILYVLEQANARVRQVTVSSFTFSGSGTIVGLGSAPADLSVSPSGKSLVVLRGDATDSLQTYVLPYPGVRYENASVEAFSRILIGHDGSIYALAQDFDRIHYWHGSSLDVDPTSDFWGGYLDVIIEK